MTVLAKFVLLLIAINAIFIYSLKSSFAQTAATNLSLTVYLHGIGISGDNANPNGGGNKSPVTTTRTLQLQVVNAANQVVSQPTGTVTYNSQAGNFQGTISGGTLSSGAYTVRIKTDKYLRRTVPGIVQVTAGQTAVVTPVALIAADINSDNIVNLSDYTVLNACLTSASTCTTQQRQMSDLTDDGIVNFIDYNFFLREYSTHIGDGENMIPITPTPTGSQVTPTLTPTPIAGGSALLPWDTTGAGFAARPASSPYVQCTVAEHAAYVATAPNGQVYDTWHPATITRSNGQKCAFGHEHGSNPARVPGAHTPYFAHGDHLGETGDFSYKVKAVELEGGRKALFTMHFGTTVPHKAACNPFHWINLQFVNSQGVLEADLSLMADFGEAVRNTDNRPLTPDACPNQAAEGRARGNGARLNPVGDDPIFPDQSGQDQPVFYYPWRMDTSPNVLGFNDGALTVNTKQIVASCKDLKCNERVIEMSANSQMNHGIWNFWSANTGWGVSDPGHTTNGVFYTDHFGKRLMNATDPMAVRQYVRPGTNIRLTKLSDQHSYFPVKGSGTYGDWIYRQMANGDSNIAGEHDANADRVDGPDTYAIWGDN